MRFSKKAFAVALLVFVLILVSGIILIDTFWSAFFNFVLGNQVYAVTVAYDSEPNYFEGNVSSVYFEWNINLVKTKVPIETILYGYRVETLKDNGLSNIKVSMRIYVYVLNRITIYDNTFNFDDANSRKITVYLYKLNVSHQRAYVEVTGYYQIGDTQSPLNAGGTFTIE